ncbi:D-tyrosyl-tRNA(Tyr) deacylase [Salibacterium salarium]|uniref:D-aminoacyl-tRNA deacylase n=1 Tax=Salibacterium salarium TaxID=284579 RepID=A0A428MZL6_9BACI|nr:D-aminoacyl-tRNA deacylase [Salibacterium salarium]RSL31600.1 D-tyrosyl-tRNA(Tyr) deacylase [Salibacterium salarium]
MRVIIQRSDYGECQVNDETIGFIDKGLVALVGFTHDDQEEDLKWMAEKVVHLRIFEDETEKMNLSLLDKGGKILSVPQFTLYGDAAKGRRPNFMKAAKPDEAKRLYNRFNELLSEKGAEVETGEFGAMMKISLTNDGPVTLILDSPDK